MSLSRLRPKAGLLFCLWACGGPGCYTSMPLYEPIRDACASTPAPCQVRLSDFTDFKWDRVGFYPGTPGGGTEAAARLGLSSFETREFENSIVFMEGDRIVRRDRMPYHCGWLPTLDPDPVYIGTVFLGEGTDAADWGVFSQDDDRFEVTEEHLGPEPVYWLRHVPMK